MPYIDPGVREALAAGQRPMLAGELNYLITKLVDDYIAARGRSYYVYNEAVGVLECAKLELYRRRVAPYEDTKLALNGDVYREGVNP